jgi:hypothetical protein
VRQQKQQQNEEEQKEDTTRLLSSKIEAAETTYRYRIYVMDNDSDTFYFADSVKLVGSFVSFSPKAVLVSSNFQDNLHGEILTFPNHLIKKITCYENDSEKSKI